MICIPWVLLVINSVGWFRLMRGCGALLMAGLGQAVSMAKEWGVTIYRAISVALIASLPIACGGAADQLVLSPLGRAMENEKVVDTTSIPSELGWAGAYLAGHHALHVHDLGSASAYYGKVLQRDSANIFLLKRTYMLLAAQGNLDDSVALVKRLQSLKIEDALATLILAVRAAQDGKYSEVERLMKMRPSSDINGFIVPLMVAWAQAGQGRVDAALVTVGALRAGGRLSALYNFHSGMLNEFAGRLTAATAHYKAAILAKGSGLSLRTVEVVGGFYTRTGQYQKAQALQSRYIKEHPTTVPIDNLVQTPHGGTMVPKPIAVSARVGLAEALFDAASTVRDDNTADTSLLFVHLALAIQADFPLAQMLLGDLLQAQACYVEARAVYNAVEQDTVIYYLTQLRVAENFYRSGDQNRAKAVLEGLARQWPIRTEALVSLGDMLRSEKRFIEAASVYDKALARIPLIEPHHWGLFYSRGVAHEQAKQWPAAEKDFLKALELYPDHPLILNYLGYSWLEKGINLDQAKKMIQRAAAQRPEDGYIMDSLGWALYMTSNYQEAVQTLEQAVELEPTDPAINDHLGDAYWRVGRYKEAYFQWERALFLNPESEIVTRIRWKLEREFKGITDVQSVVKP